MARLRMLGLPLALLGGALAGSLLTVDPGDSPVEEAGECAPERYVVEAVCVAPGEEAAGLLLLVPRLSTATPVASDTPVVTEVPQETVAPVMTDVPLPTVAPTATPEATATSTASATVTPSPIVSPIPTATSAPDEGCYGTVIATLPLNLRADHTTGPTVLGQAQPGSSWRIAEVWPTDPDAPADEWVRVRLADGRDAWMASFYGGEDYLRFETTDACAAVRWPNGKVEATGTPQPSVTGTPIPGATITPISSEPAVEGTPTPESGITPVPTGESGKTCTVTLLEGSMIRAGAGTGYASVGSAAAGEQLVISRVVTDGMYAWGEHARGWTALYTLADSAWRVGVWGSEGEVCLDVPGWSEAGLGVPNLMGAVGWHVTIPDIDYTDLVTSLDALASGGYTPVVKAVEDTRSVQEALARGGIGVWRTTHAGDCADMEVDPKLAAWLRLVGQGPYLPAPQGVTYVEVDNECPQYFDDLAWADAYQAEVIRLYSERGYRVIFGTQPPGWYEQHQVRALPKTWAAARRYGACLGYHAYGVTKGRRVADSDVWTGYRHRLIREWLNELGYGDVPICATEVGTGDGRDAFDATDFVDWNRAVRYDGLRFTAWWTAGTWGGMTANGQMKEATETYMRYVEKSFLMGQSTHISIISRISNALANFSSTFSRPSRTLLHQVLASDIV
jgi:hypothetical protein